ncbi:hypothetical protein [Spirosoma flavus]
MPSLTRPSATEVPTLADSTDRWGTYRLKEVLLPVKPLTELIRLTRFYGKYPAFAAHALSSEYAWFINRNYDHWILPEQRSISYSFEARNRFRTCS